MKYVIIILGVFFVLSGPSCKKGGFLGCENVLAFELNGEIYNATLFNNTLTGYFDPYSGVQGLLLTMNTEDDAGNAFTLRIFDFRNAIGNCITVEPYYADQGLNYCLFAPAPYCNQFTAEYLTQSDGDFVTTGTTGQIDILNCDGSDRRISGSFSFQVESLESGNISTLGSGSFNLCYLVL